MVRRYRIKSKFRFTVFMVLLIMVLGIMAGNLLGYNDASGDSKAQYETVIVSEGDTLWTIAERYWDKSSDLRQLIYEISKINNIESGQIFVGQEISIPI